jgi:hypothetical protein
MEVASVVVKLNEAIDANLKRELERHYIFHSFKVYPWTHETDEISIVRIAFMFRPASNIDVFLKKFEIGLKFVDILPEFSASLTTSATLNNILESKKFCLGQDLAAIASISATVARKIVGKVFEEILYFVEQGSSQERVEKLERKGIFGAAVKRSKEAIFGKSKNGQDINNMNQDVSVTGFKEDRRDNVDSHISTKQFLVKLVRLLSWSTINFLKTTKATNSDYSFPNLSEMLFGNAWIRSKLPSWVNRDVLEEPGHLAKLWTGSLDWLHTNLQVHWRRVLNNEKAEEIWREQTQKAHEERLAKMSKKERANYEFMEEKRALALKLKSLGIDSGGVLEVEKEVIDNAQFLRREKGESLKSERLLLETYNSCCNSLFGVHAVVVQCGVHRLSFELQGCDIFDMLPMCDENADLKK